MVTEQYIETLNVMIDDKINVKKGRGKKESCLDLLMACH
jgi:hypothetical protein